MNHLRRLVIAILIAVLVMGGTNFSVQSAQASGVCSLYHTVRYGESLSGIGRYYNVNWLHLAQINGIQKPYRVYAGQVLCISSDGAVQPPQPGPVSMEWNFAVIGVQQNTSVTIQTAYFPDNVKFEVLIGRLTAGVYEWKKVADLDSDKGGVFKETFGLPAEFAGTPQLVIRLTQSKKNVSVDRWFGNIPNWAGTGGWGPGGWPGGPGGWYYGSIPTISIKSVVRDSKVTIITHNFPANVQFDVLMGPYGTKGINGYLVSSFNSGAGGSFELTFDIPVQLYGSPRIAIRTQNLATGYFSYNWFYNTAY